MSTLPIPLLPVQYGRGRTGRGREVEAGYPSVLGRICTYLLHVLVPYCKVDIYYSLPPRHFLPELSRESFQYSELST